MTPIEVQAIVEAEIGSDWSQSNLHNVNLKACLVTPRVAACRNSFPMLEGGRDLELWIVLEETPGSGDGYLIVFDEQRLKFGLADWNGNVPVFLRYHGTFMNTLAGM